MDAGIIIGIAILAGIVVYGLKKTKSSKKSSSSNGGGTVITDDVVGPKPDDGTPQPKQNPKLPPVDLDPPKPKDFR